MSSKAEQVKQATKVAKSTKKRVIRRKYQVRDKLRFFKPRTLRVASKPKYLNLQLHLKHQLNSINTQSSLTQSIPRKLTNL